MNDLNINYSNTLDIKNNKNSPDNITDNITDNILSNLDTDQMINLEQKNFFNNYYELTEDQQQRILEEIKIFLSNQSNRIILINNVRVVLANNYGAFSNKSLQIINFLKDLAKNDTKKLKYIYERIKGLNSHTE